MEKSFYKIFITFFKVGTILLGGGYVILPILTSELVEKKKWLTSDELCEFYAISTSLPGIIAVNTTIMTGRKIAGRKGALAATIGVISPAFLTIILIASILNELAAAQTIQNIFWGIGIGVITLLFLAAKEMWPKCVNDKFSSIIYTLCLLMALSGKISPAITVIFAIICGLISNKIYIKKENKS